MIFQHDSSNKIDCSYHAVHIRPSALFMLCYLQSCGKLLSCSGRVTLPNLNLVYIDVCCKIAASKGG
ncbi:hypothetical protein DZF45_09055 [Salmonella enterica]|nr:hypothetical protein [Salmonella enterica]